MPPATDGVDRGVEHCQSVDADLLEHLAGGEIRQQAGQILRRPGHVRAVRLHPDRVHDGVRAPAVGEVPQCICDVGAGLQAARVDHLDTVPGGHLPALRNDVDADHPAIPVLADAGRKLPDGPSPKTARVPPSGGSA